MNYLEAFGIRHVALDFIDKDHEEAAHFIETILNTIQNAELSPTSKETILPLLQALLAHKKEHFEREESSMLSVQFPALPRHRQEHNRVINELNALINHWQQYQDMSALRTYMHHIFPLWLKSHSETMDHAIAEYISSHQQSH